MILDCVVYTPHFYLPELVMGWATFHRWICFSVLRIQCLLLDLLPDLDAGICSTKRGGGGRRTGVENVFFCLDFFALFEKNMFYSEGRRCDTMESFKIDSEVHFLQNVFSHKLWALSLDKMKTVVLCFFILGLFASHTFSTPLYRLTWEEFFWRESKLTQETIDTIDQTRQTGC